MEKSRAIELLKLAVPIKALTQQEYSDFVEAVNMGMDALEQPTSPDTIDRQAAINALQKCRKHCIDPFDSYHIDIQDAENQLWKVPTIQPEKAQLSKEGTTYDLISRTETVEHLRRVLDVTVPITDYDSGYVDGVEFGVSTVSTMPTIQPQSTAGQLNDGARSTNLIDRQQAIDALDCISGVEEVLKSLPSVQPEPHEGHWIRHETPDGGEQYECSRCGVLWEFNDGTPEDNEAYFCPKCGTKMKGVRHESY